MSNKEKDKNVFRCYDVAKMVIKEVIKEVVIHPVIEEVTGGGGGEEVECDGECCVIM